MIARSVAAAALVIGLASTALAGVPALTTDWVPLYMSQGECLQRAEWVMRSLGLRRIERIDTSVFADSVAGEDQVTIRCFAEKQMVLFVAAGSHGNENITRRLTSSMVDLFRGNRR